MKKLLIYIIITVFFPLGQVFSQNNYTSSSSPWPVIRNANKPFTRWWWMGNAVDIDNIRSLLTEYNRVGLGGVEIVPIYGAKGFEEKYISYLSPRWMNMLDSTVNIARRLGMVVDISIGSGWPVGGPEVTLKDAATKLKVQKYFIPAGEHFHQQILLLDSPFKNEIIKPAALVSYDSKGKFMNLSNNLSKNIIDIAPQKNDQTILAFFNSKTLQKVKRAAPGGEGYTLDHFSAQAVNHYLQYLDKSFGSNSHGVRSFYNDSYEVFNADWSEDFLHEFQKRRGYSLLPYISWLADSTKTDSDSLARLKSDYRETMSDMMLDNFTRKITSWAHGKKAQFLNQAHGSPGNLLDLYAAVDIPETETFGSSVYAIPGLRRDMYEPRIADTEPLMFKFASSAAHVMGHTLVSSETHTWITEHFKTNLALCKPEAENLFLAGINHIFFHGTTYSPANVPWPGWLFYASVEFTPANSLWNHLKGYTDYIARCQSVLQSGKPDNDVLLYWPVYDLWNDSKGMDMPFRAHNIDMWIHGSSIYNASLLLTKNGYSFDYVSDNMIQKASIHNQYISIGDKEVTYKAIVIPACTYMPVPVLNKIINMARSGAVVIMDALPKDIPGLYQLQSRRIALKSMTGNLQKSMINGVAKIGAGKIIISKELLKSLQEQQIYGESLPAIGLQFIRRKTPLEKYYYIVNHTAHAIDSFFVLRHHNKVITIMDPQTGDFGLAQTRMLHDGSLQTRIQLKPGESVIIKSDISQKDSKKWQYLGNITDTIGFKNQWSLHFTEGGPKLPRDYTMHQLQLWTDLKDSVYQNFSGTAVYATRVYLERKNTNEYILQLPNLYEAALVKINGHDAGYIYGVPYELRIGKYLREGENSVEIEVSNLMANHIRYMDRNKIAWKNYHEINFVDKEYKPFDASNWHVMPSGLKEPVYLIGYR